MVRENKPFELENPNKKFKERYGKYYIIYKGNDRFSGKIIYLDSKSFKLSPYKGITTNSEGYPINKVLDGKVFEMEYKFGELGFEPTTRKVLEAICDEQNEKRKFERLELKLKTRKMEDILKENNTSQDS